MATQVTNYQCPACTGPLHFVGESGRLECDYCGSNFDIAEIEAFYAEKEAKAAEAAQKQEKTEAAQNTAEAEEKKSAADGSDWDASGLSEDWGVDAADMKAYCCPSCGAELLCDATTAATRRAAVGLHAACVRAPVLAQTGSIPVRAVCGSLLFFRFGRFLSRFRFFLLLRRFRRFRFFFRVERFNFCDIEA